MLFFVFELHTEAQNTTGKNYKSINLTKTTDTTYSAGFEDASNVAGVVNSGAWTVATDKAATGSKSLKFTKAAATAVSGLYSIDTEQTIMKVRTAKNNNKTYIVASTYEGTVMGVDYNGAILWKNTLSGFMNHDLWCDDITGDGNDEVMVANADGTTYCLNQTGKLLWKFRPDEAPMYAVCVVQKNNIPYVVCGGFDKSIYYLSASGSLIKEIKSSTYSQEKNWGTGVLPPNYTHTSNFIRRIRQADGKDILVVLGTNNHMQSNGSIYKFDVLTDVPFSKVKINSPNVIGELRVVEPKKDGEFEILMGTSGLNDDAMVKYNVAADTMLTFGLTKIGTSGYRVLQPEIITNGSSYQYFMIDGNYIILASSDLTTSVEKIYGKYAFNDMWKNPKNENIILASSQSGGSCIHIVDTKNSNWKMAFAALVPTGKIETILANTALVKTNLQTFVKPSWERATLPVWFMSENFGTTYSTAIYNTIKANYTSPVFLNNTNLDKENWDRSAMTNVKYRDKRDSRMNYVLTQQQVLDKLLPEYTGWPGVSYWGGHGNDPYMYSLETTKKVLDGAAGKKTTLIYPEMGDRTEDFTFVMNDLFYPLAQYAQGKNANIFVRSKNIFWQSLIYLPAWTRVLTGEFSEVFVPSMEETTDKTMDLSLAGRIGLWAAGTFDGWGARVSRDNPSFDRSRQFSYQRLPNHFLRTMIYSVSCGAQYLDNSNIDDDYMSLLWELIAKGALFVPKKSEIVSFSPVHLSMVNPDEDYMEDGDNCKWNTFYDKTFQDNNSFVFSHMNGTWPGAPVTDWDFSRYASGVKDRRQNFMPPTPNGMVLITPPQEGVNAQVNPARGAMTDHLHPLYKSIMKEYYTDGRYYYSADGVTKYNAKDYYTTIEADIKASANLLPLTVTGDVAWVVAQTSPTHLRLTIIDNGYLNPGSRIATVSFHSVSPKNMKDILDAKTFDISNPASISIDIPCGMFRFIDIELNSPLN